MGILEVLPVRTARQKNEFVHFPWTVYRGNTRHPNWVPPLLMDEKHTLSRTHNKFFKHGVQQEFLAYRDGRPVGRIAAILDQSYVDFQKKDDAFFGFFECFDDVEAARALVGAVRSFAKEQGMSRILGPINQSTGQILGLLVSAFDLPPVVKMPWNPEYYGRLLEESGFQKEIDLHSYTMDTSHPLSDKIQRVSELARKRNKVEIRLANMKDWDATVEIVRELWNDAWVDNWGFTPWTAEEFRVLAADLKMIMDKDMVFLATIEGRPAGFAFPVPDVNEILIKMNGRLLPTGIFQLLGGLKQIKTLRVAAFAVRREFRNLGVDAAFIAQLYMKGTAKGYTRADFSWILETNIRLTNMLENWGAKHYKTHRIYQSQVE